MSVRVSGKNIQVGESLTQHIEQTLESLLQKYFNGRGDSSVVLTRESSSFQCDISIHLPGNMILHAHTSAPSDAQSVFLDTEQKIAKQLRRYKRRLSNYALKEPDALEATEYVLKTHDEEPEEHEESHLVIAEQDQKIETLSVSDAVMRIDLGNLDYLLFKNPDNLNLNFIYRRKDGHFGWLNPE